MLSVCFAKFHPNLIVGGTYSGQIVLWDNRNRKKTPVQKTPLSSTAHTVSVTKIFDYKMKLMVTLVIKSPGLSSQFLES